MENPLRAYRSNSVKKILLVCAGNICRSPMAKVIFEQKLKEISKLNEFKIDSAACDGPTDQSATTEAREAIMRMYGKDLLASHKPKNLTQDMVQHADLILVMSEKMKEGLPVGKAYTLKEYAGDAGSIADPFWGNVDTFLKTAQEISSAIDKIIPQLICQ